MTRRRVLVLVLIAAAIGLAVRSSQSGPKPGRETFDQVRIGMTYEEVVATLGGPPGKYLDPDEGCWISTRGMGYWSYKDWITRDGTLLILFKEGRAIDITEDLVLLFPKPSLWDRFQTWLGW